MNLRTILRDSQAITLAIAKVRKADAHAKSVEEKANALRSSHKSGRVTTEHYLARTKMLADELTRATDVWCDALNDFYVATLTEACEDPYQSDGSEISQLLSLSIAGGA